MTTSQQRYPWRATLRTVFAFLVSLASVWGVIVELLGLDQTWQWVSASLVVSAGVTRLLADARILALLEKFAPWLLPEPPRAEQVESGLSFHLGR